jgi:hypothetical protein
MVGPNGGSRQTRVTVTGQQGCVKLPIKAVHELQESVININTCGYRYWVDRSGSDIEVEANGKTWQAMAR